MSIKKQARPKPASRDRTRVPGQNPRANDAPDRDVYHDENRRNLYDPEVGKSLRRSGQKTARHLGLKEG